MEPIVGIDLGTTNSEVAFLFAGHASVIKEGDNGIVPSCVGLDPSGKIVVGQVARNQYAAMPDRTVISIKRRMGSDDRVPMGPEMYTPQEISAFILKELKDRASRHLGQPVSKAVITVPAYFTDAQRQATREAGAIAGLEVVRIINEPTAAALAYESGHQGSSKILVYDLGGGTFDVSIVNVEDGVVEVLASTGDNHLGGDDFDQKILHWLLNHITEELGLTIGEDRILCARLLRAAERAKIHLSDHPFARIEEDHIGQKDGRDVHLSVELPRSEFEEMIEEDLLRTMDAVTRALSDAALLPSAIDKILLVGGSTRIPYITRLLRDKLGKEPHGEIDPDLCVALGAAIQAGMEMGAEVKSVLVDITPYTFGTSAIGLLHGRPYMHLFVPLIRRNSKLPVSKMEVFYTAVDQQEAVDMRVFQGENEDALKNILIGNFMFRGLSPVPAGNEILFSLELDLDGILHVRAMEKRTGKEIRGVIEEAVSRSSATQISTARERVEAMWEEQEMPYDTAGKVIEIESEQASAHLPADIADVLERAAQMLDTASPEDQEEMVNLIEEIREAIDMGDIKRASARKEELDDILFYLE